MRHLHSEPLLLSCSLGCCLLHFLMLTPMLRCICVVLLAEELKNTKAAQDPLTRGLAMSLSRGLPLGQLDETFCSGYNGIMVGDFWTLAKVSPASMATPLLNTEGVSTDLSVIDGACEPATWSLYAADGVSTDLGCTLQVRRPKVSVQQRRLKPCRTKAFIGQFPAKWREEMNKPEVIEQLNKWAASSWKHKKNAKRSLELFHRWMEERLPGPLRSCTPSEVSDMPLVFRQGTAYTMRQLDRCRLPDHPGTAFCQKHGLQGVFYPTDFPMPTWMTSPKDVTLRYHGTNLYGVAAASAAGHLA